MMEQLQPVITRLTQYGELIATGMLVMFGGMIAVFLLYRLASAVIRPGGSYARLMKVVFGSFYVMILVIAVLLAADKLGFHVEGIAGIAILLVIVGGVIVFFLIPFLPRLPFVPGDMVEVKGIMGTVEAITAYQTVIRTFDGQTVFIPSAAIMASAIRNYSTIPNRRIQLDVEIYAGDDIEQARAMLLQLMTANAAVLDDPAPSVFVTAVDGEKATLVAYCWVPNSDWFGTRDALWVAAAAAFANEQGVSLALPQLDLHQSPPAE